MTDIYSIPCSSLCDSWMTLYEKMHTAAVSFTAVGLALDVIITLVMCWLLYHNRTEYAHTNSIIKKLVCCCCKVSFSN
jgi:hypothetical protein